MLWQMVGWNPLLRNTEIISENPDKQGLGLRVTSFHLEKTKMNTFIRSIPLKKIVAGKYLGAHLSSSTSIPSLNSALSSGYVTIGQVKDAASCYNKCWESGTAEGLLISKRLLKQGTPGAAPTIALDNIVEASSESGNDTYRSGKYLEAVKHAAIFKSIDSHPSLVICLHNRAAACNSITKKEIPLLGITECVRESEIKKAYRNVALKYHPDKEISLLSLIGGMTILEKSFQPHDVSSWGELLKELIPRWVKFWDRLYRLAVLVTVFYGLHQIKEDWSGKKAQRQKEVYAKIDESHTLLAGLKNDFKIMKSRLKRIIELHLASNEEREELLKKIKSELSSENDEEPNP